MEKLTPEETAKYKKEGANMTFITCNKNII